MRGRTGGWDALDAAYQSGLLSTEQVLHPDKSLSGSWDGPTWIDLERLAPPKGWEVVTTDTHGEANAWSIAEGLDGNRYRLFARGEDLALSWRSEGDSVADASAFEAAASAWFTEGVVERRGRAVVVTNGWTAKEHKRVVKATWKAHTSEPRDEREMWGPDAGSPIPIATGR